MGFRGRWVKVALHDSESKKFPNLALMKISSYHKSLGNDVVWFDPLFGPYDSVYSSKIFTFNKDDPYLPGNVKKGGTGYDLKTVLPDEIDCLCPDYNLYDIGYSLGFLTRGCIRKCESCFVPEKEGDIRPYMDIEEFLRHDKVVLMDNNVLAHDWGIEQIDKIARLGIKVDFNQGLDSRLIDDRIAKKLGKVKWLKPLRLACDRKSQMIAVEKAVHILRKHNVTPKRYFCYVLVREDVDDALERVEFLREFNVDSFAQPYMDKDGTPPTKEQKRFARWVNHKAIFKTVKWKDYR